MNIAIDKLSDTTKYLLIYSKEVEAREQHLEIMLEELNKRPQELLVVGCQFEVKGKSALDNKLQSLYSDKNLIAYNIPWNTCAIWNYRLFKKYVTRFDEVTTRNLFPSIKLIINGKQYKTEHQGMEDGLAIAKAVNQKSELRYNSQTYSASSR